jgi:hypothetical protein
LQQTEGLDHDSKSIAGSLLAVLSPAYISISIKLIPYGQMTMLPGFIKVFGAAHVAIINWI